jgi:integrase
LVRSLLGDRPTAGWHTKAKAPCPPFSECERLSEKVGSHSTQEQLHGKVEEDRVHTGSRGLNRGFCREHFFPGLREETLWRRDEVLPRFLEMSYPATRHGPSLARFSASRCPKPLKQRGEDTRQETLAWIVQVDEDYAERDLYRSAKPRRVRRHPTTGVRIPKGKKHGRKRLAYSLEEILKHLQLFNSDSIVIINKEGPHTPEVGAGIVRAVIGVTAFAGLRRGEVRGLWWDDDGGDLLSICPSMWHSTLKNTKTEEDVDEPGLVPIIKPLRLLLDAIKPAHASGFIFPNSIGGALDLDNLADRGGDRVIRPTLKAHNLMWWQAYRRGLATNLKELGVPDTTIQCILRHENVNTTQRFYIKTASAVAVDAMKKLEKKIGSVQESVNTCVFAGLLSVGWRSHPRHRILSTRVLGNVFRPFVILFMPSLVAISFYANSLKGWLRGLVRHKTASPKP